MPVTTPAAARKIKQIGKLLNLLASNQRSLLETISSFACIVGVPVDRDKRGGKSRRKFSFRLVNIIMKLTI